jgi:hypothetical protein
MENDSEKAVEEGTNPPDTRPLDEDLGHAAPDDASTNPSSKRPREEEEEEDNNCNQESIEDEPQTTKRRKIEDEQAIKTEEPSSGVKNQVNGNSGSLNVLTEETPQGDEVEVIKPDSLLSVFSPVLTRSRATDKTTENGESGGEATSPDDEEIIPCTPSSESGVVAADDNDSTSRIHSGRWRGEKYIWMVEKDICFVFNLCWLIMLYL